MCWDVTKGVAAPGGVGPALKAVRAHSGAPNWVGNLAGHKGGSMPGAAPAGYGLETNAHSSVVFCRLPRSTSPAPPALDVSSLPRFAAQASRAAHAEMDEVTTGAIDSELRDLHFG